MCLGMLWKQPGDQVLLLSQSCVIHVGRGSREDITFLKQARSGAGWNSGAVHMAFDCEKVGGDGFENGNLDVGSESFADAIDGVEIYKLTLVVCM